MLAPTIVTAGAGLLAYGVRGRSAQLFGPSVWRGPSQHRTIALTFDDGPSEGTPALLKLLSDYRIPATFFHCGANVRRLPAIAREVLAAGHELGNHSDSHPLSCLRTPSAIYDDFARAQHTYQDLLQTSPKLVRPPFGVRWFGYRAMQQKLGLLNVMWTALAQDWKLPAEAITNRVLRLSRNGSILCLHDGRACQAPPDIRNTLDAVQRILPVLLERGFAFQTVTRILCPIT